MQELVNWLNDRTKEYDEGHPTVSDFEWDRKYFELQKMEKEKNIVLLNSPTHTIKFDIVNELTKVKHNHPMLSAAKTKDWQDFITYFGNKDVIGMLKLDGLTLSLKYVDGQLISAETRGDGEVGEDVTHNAKVISSIPKYIDYKDELIVDGEIICTEKDFEPFSADYKNPRNFASGSIRLLDANECAKRNLTFIVWNIIEGFNDDNSFLDRLNKIKNLGFIIVPHTSSFDCDAKEFLTDKAKKLGYPIDGLVGRFDDVEYGNNLGSTGHHTKAIYAFKFYDEEYETELIDIEWSMGRTGQITPVAIYKDIEMDGSICNRASLHNVSVLEKTLGLPFRGQKIKVFKSNEIIPQISWAEKWTVDKPFLMHPVTCPICGGQVTYKNNNGVETCWCENPTCEGQLINQLDHFCSKKGLDIKGLSKATIEKLIDNGWLGNIREIFSLSNFKTEWQNLPGFGVASVTKILNAIEDAKNTTLEKFISALGIPLIGSTVAKEIVKHYPTWEEFKEARGGEWSLLDGFGPAMEESLNNFDYTEADEIAQLLNFETKEDNGGNDLKGTIWCITGKSSLGSRDAVKKMIEEAGGKVTTSVSSKTNYLVANAVENTSKYNNAVAMNIPIVNDEELLKILGRIN